MARSTRTITPRSVPPLILAVGIIVCLSAHAAGTELDTDWVDRAARAVQILALDPDTWSHSSCWEESWPSIGFRSWPSGGDVAPRALAGLLASGQSPFEANIEKGLDFIETLVDREDSLARLSWTVLSLALGNRAKAAERAATAVIGRISAEHESSDQTNALSEYSPREIALALISLAFVRPRDDVPVAVAVEVLSEFVEGVITGSEPPVVPDLAIAAIALHVNGKPSIARDAVGWLVNQQRESGDWTSHAEANEGTKATAWALAACRIVGGKDCQAAVSAATRYLERTQSRAGVWTADPLADLEILFACSISLPPSPHRFLCSLLSEIEGAQHPQGYWSIPVAELGEYTYTTDDFWRLPVVFETIERLLREDKLRADYIVTAAAVKTWRLVATIGCLDALLNGGREPSSGSVVRALGYLLECQSPDGSWYGSLPLTLDAIRTMLLAGADPNAPSVRKARRFISEAGRSLYAFAWLEEMIEVGVAPTGTIAETQSLALLAELGAATSSGNSATLAELIGDFSHAQCVQYSDSCGSELRTEAETLLRSLRSSAGTWGDSDSTTAYVLWQLREHDLTLYDELRHEDWVARACDRAEEHAPHNPADVISLVEAVGPIPQIIAPLDWARAGWVRRASDPANLLCFGAGEVLSLLEISRLCSAVVGSATPPRTHGSSVRVLRDREYEAVLILEGGTRLAIREPSSASPWLIEAEISEVPGHSVCWLRIHVPTDVRSGTYELCVASETSVACLQIIVCSRLIGEWWFWVLACFPALVLGASLLWRGPRDRCLGAMRRGYTSIRSLFRPNLLGKPIEELKVLAPGLLTTLLLATLALLFSARAYGGLSNLARYAVPCVLTLALVLRASWTGASLPWRHAVALGGIAAVLGLSIAWSAGLEGSSVPKSLLVIALGMLLFLSPPRRDCVWWHALLTAGKSVLVLWSTVLLAPSTWSVTYYRPLGGAGMDRAHYVLLTFLPGVAGTFWFLLAAFVTAAIAASLVRAIRGAEATRHTSGGIHEHLDSVARLHWRAAVGRAGGDPLHVSRPPTEGWETSVVATAAWLALGVGISFLLSLSDVWVVRLIDARSIGYLFGLAALAIVELLGGYAASVVGKSAGLSLLVQLLAHPALAAEYEGWNASLEALGVVPAIQAAAVLVTVGVFTRIVTFLSAREKRRRRRAQSAACPARAESKKARHGSLLFVLGMIAPPLVLSNAVMLFLFYLSLSGYRFREGLALFKFFRLGFTNPFILQTVSVLVAVFLLLVANRACNQFAAKRRQASRPGTTQAPG